jgi:hypothetical protein
MSLANELRRRAVLDFLLTLLIAVVVLGVVAYVIQTFIPMDPRIKQLVLLVLGVVFLIWLLLALMGQAPVWRWQGPPRGVR